MSHRPHSPLKRMFRLWLPLAISFELMMLEGPAIQGAVGRLPDSKLNLAAWGLTMSLSLLIESPVIMLLSTAIALVKGRMSYLALRRFTVNLAVWCTLLTALVSFTPIFDFIAVQLLGQPIEIMEAARIPMQLMLLWTAAIAWRRFYQGVLIRYGQTRRVSFGTMIRLSSAILVIVIMVHRRAHTGAEVCAYAIMAAVLSEALTTTLFALPILRRDILPVVEEAPQPTQKEIWQFHAPLAATTLLTLLAGPITAGALSRLPNPADSLAAWPVAYMILLVMRGWCFALQEITVAQADDEEKRAALKRFTVGVGWATSLGTLALVATPLLSLYCQKGIELRPELYEGVRTAVLIGMFLPLITAMSSWARGLLVKASQTKQIYRGMGINLVTHASILTIGVLSKAPGMALAAVAFTVSNFAEYLFLWSKLRAIDVEALPLALETA